MYGTPGHRIVSFRPWLPLEEGHLVFAPAKHLTHIGQDPGRAAQLIHQLADRARRRDEQGDILMDCAAPLHSPGHHLHVHWVPTPSRDGLLRYGHPGRCRCLEKPRRPKKRAWKGIGEAYVRELPS